MEVFVYGRKALIKLFKHFAFYLGKPVTVRLYAPLNGSKTLAGKLAAYNEKALTLEIEGEQTILNLDAVAKVLTAEEL